MENISKQEKRELKKKEKEEKSGQEKRKRKIKKFLNISYAVVAVVAFVWGVSFLASGVKKLPPTTMQGHVEESPASHILTEEMPENIQKHMLEHADGSGSPGVIIQYNCEKFECEDNLVEKLEKIVEEYSSFVYLAPNSKYDGKIILTRSNKIKVLDSFNKEEIRAFIIN